MSSGRINTYRDLIACQRGMSLVLAVYRATDATPDSETFGLRSRMRRSAVSLPSNIAEGYGRESTQDSLRFLCLPRGSLYELRTQVEIAQSPGYLTLRPDLDSLLGETDRVSQGLIRGIERSDRQ
ncbi:MAG: four helix bundle protein [Phycisphaeraceae bacterium]|nr:four helix bundle protein [Phycisphaeraceae bacterium]